MAEKTVSVKLRAEVASYIAGMQKASLATKQLGKDLTGSGRVSSDQLALIGRTAAVAAGSIALGFAAAAKTAIDWESAWAGVTKTVEGSAAEMQGLEDGLRGMAKELPATHSEIAAVAEAAGALGIATPAIEGFTRTMIDLGETTDLTADQAATSMAQIANVMQTPQDQFDEMGSTLVELGNNGASTESQILELANRLAGAGAIAGLTEANVFAFASTLASVGVEAEAGGTAFSKVFIKMRDAVLDGSEQLDTFAEVAGVSAAEFAAAFREDPAAAIDSFIQGLGRINDAGQSTSGVFAALELTDSRLMTAMLKTAGAGDLLAESLAMGDQAWKDNNALQTEAEKRYSTTAAQAEMLRNQIVDLGIGIGDRLLPAITGAVSVLGTMVAGMSALEGPAGGVLQGITGVAGALSGLIAVAAILGPQIMKMRDALIAMGAAGQFAAAAIPWLAAAGAAIAAVTFILGQNQQAHEAAEESVKSWRDAIRDSTSVAAAAEMKLGELAENNEKMAAAMAASGMAIEDWAAGLSGTDAQFDSFIADLRFAAATVGGDLGVELKYMADQILPIAREQMLLGGEAAENLGTFVGKSGEQAAVAAGGHDAAATAIQSEGEAAEEAEEQIRGLIEARRAQIDPFFAVLDAFQQSKEAQDALMAAAIANTDAIDDNNVSVAEMDKLYRDAAAAALGVEAAATELEFAMDNQGVSIEGASAMLQGWVANGLLTEEQAVQVAEQIGGAALVAEMFGRIDETAKVDVDKDDADRKMSHAERRMRYWGTTKASAVAAVNNKAAMTGIDAATKRVQTFNRLRATAALYANANSAYATLAGFQRAANAASAVVRITSKALGYGSEAGGVVGRNMKPPGRTDTVPMMLAPGEYVIRADSARALGYGNLDRLNATGKLPGGTGSVAQTYGVRSTSMSVGGAVTNVTVDMRGSVVSSRGQFEQMVTDALQRGQARNGAVRVRTR